MKYATGKDSIVAGRLSQEFFSTAVNDIRVPEENVIMIGDVITTDIKGAMDAGLKACLVKTGKYRVDVFSKAGINPHFILDSIESLEDIIE